MVILGRAWDVESIFVYLVAATILPHRSGDCVDRYVTVFVLLQVNKV